ncbi:signal peptidase I [Geodermatophilus sp. CPCC 206100]|uniref:signal peptidase I n=1 Tax=Geodermatophilus sp. CPCC 206100 TaxID=3020054 RepID=UPI003AFF9453
MPSPAPTSTAAGSAWVHTLRRVASWVLGAVLLTGTGAALGLVAYPMVTGGAALAVLSGSMTPGLPVGAMAFTKPVEDPATLQVGDVITFQRRPDAPELVTHRIMAVDASSGTPVFTTQGDANNAPDVDPVPASAVRGELAFSVDDLGRTASILQSPKGAGMLIVLVCAVIALSPGPRPKESPDRDRSAKRDRSTTTADRGEEPPTPLTGDATVHLQVARPAVPPPRSAIGLLH